MREETNLLNIDKHVARFEELSALQEEAPTAWQLIGKVIARKGWNRAVFCKRSLLDEAIYYKAKRGDDTPPSLHTLMAVCVGMDLDMPATEELLAAAGYKFSKAIPLHRAYMYIIGHLAGQPVHVRNEFLKRLRINELGSQNYLGK